MNGLLTLTWSNVKSAIVYGLLTAAVTFLLVVGNAITQHGSIFGLYWKVILDQATVAFIGVLVAGVSILKNLLTDSQGKFLGIWEVIPDKSPVAKTQ